MHAYSAWVRYRPGDPWQVVSTVTSANEYDAFAHAEAAGQARSGWSGAASSMPRIGVSMVVLPAGTMPYAKARRRK
jgi:hypothetical protein